MNKILGPEVSYCDLLDYEITEHLKNEKKDFFPLRPSAAGKCSRALAYDLMAYKGYATYDKKPIEPNIYRLFELGHSVEYSALKNFKLLKDFSLRYKQQSLHMFNLEPTEEGKDGQIIEGSLDVVLWSEKHRCVLDVKSQKDGFSSAFKTRWAETIDKYSQMKTLVQFGASAFYADDLEAFCAELGGDFLVDNLVQLNLYACTEFLRERKVDHGVIYKYNKNTSEHYEIRFKPSMAMFKATQKKFDLINQAVAKKEPETVPKDFLLGGMRCAFCPYSKECWGQDGTKAWFKTFPKKEWPEPASEVSETLPALLTKYEEGLTTEKDTVRLEQDILATMEKAKVNKIKLDNGHVYEAKYLKSPKPHYELRRTKL